jgi:hypothetical protein
MASKDAVIEHSPLCKCGHGCTLTARSDAHDVCCVNIFTCGTLDIFGYRILPTVEMTVAIFNYKNVNKMIFYDLVNFMRCCQGVRSVLNMSQLLAITRKDIKNGTILGRELDAEVRAMPNGSLERIYNTLCEIALKMILLTTRGKDTNTRCLANRIYVTLTKYCGHKPLPLIKDRYICEIIRKFNDARELRQELLVDLKYIFILYPGMFCKNFVWDLIVIACALGGLHNIIDRAVNLSEHAKAHLRTHTEFVRQIDVEIDADAKLTDEQNATMIYIVDIVQLLSYISSVRPKWFNKIRYNLIFELYLNLKPYLSTANTFIYCFVSFMYSNVTANSEIINDYVCEERAGVNDWSILRGIMQYIPQESLVESRDVAFTFADDGDDNDKDTQTYVVHSLVLRIRSVYFDKLFTKSDELLAQSISATDNNNDKIESTTVKWPNELVGLITADENLPYEIDDIYIMFLCWCYDGRFNESRWNILAQSAEMRDVLRLQLKMLRAVKVLKSNDAILQMCYHICTDLTDEKVRIIYELIREDPQIPYNDINVYIARYYRSRIWDVMTDDFYFDDTVLADFRFEFNDMCILSITKK